MFTEEISTKFYFLYFSRIMENVLYQVLATYEKKYFRIKCTFIHSLVPLKVMFSLFLYHYFSHDRDVSNKSKTQVLKINQKEM